MSQLPLVFLLLLLNLGISWWNAYAVGHAWVESKHAGGSRRFMAWMGALMSGAGFTWCYFIIIGLILGATHVLDARNLQLLFDVGYVMVIPVVLFAGWAITIDSWKRAYHQRTLGNMGVAGWNSFASMYNTYNAVEGFGGVLGDIFKNFSADDEDGDGAPAMLVLLLALAAAALGAITTTLLIKHYAGKERLEAIRDRAGVGSSTYGSERRSRY
jgi:hypothetical protein